MTQPVPLMRVYHFPDCTCYKCDARRENNLNLPNGEKRTVLTVVVEEVDELTPLAISVLRYTPQRRRNTQ